MPRNRPSAIAAEIGMLSRGRSIRMIYAFQSPVRAAGEVGRLRLSALVAAPDEFSPEVLAVVHKHGLAGIAIREMDAEFAPGAAQAPR